MCNKKALKYYANLPNAILVDVTTTAQFIH